MRDKRGKEVKQLTNREGKECRWEKADRMRGERKMIE